MVCWYGRLLRYKWKTHEMRYVRILISEISLMTNMCKINILCGNIHDRRCKCRHTRKGYGHGNGMISLTNGLGLIKNFSTTFVWHDIRVNNMRNAKQQINTNFITFHHSL